MLQFILDVFRQRFHSAQRTAATATAKNLTGTFTRRWSMNRHGVNPVAASPSPSQPQSLLARPVNSSMKTSGFVYQARSLISSVGRGLTPLAKSASFVLLSSADWLIFLIGRYSTESSSIQQTRIESVLDRPADFDLFEIAMLWI